MVSLLYPLISKEKLCLEKNFELAIFEKIFILQNQLFTLQTMKQEFREKETIGNISEFQVNDALLQVEQDLIKEKKKYNFIFKKDFFYYI